MSALSFATTQELTMVLTDVVDSTLLNTRLGDDAMAALWAAHDRATRASIRAFRGREVGRSDGFLVVFGRALEIEAARRLQAGLPSADAASVGRALDEPHQAMTGPWPTPMPRRAALR